MVDHPPPLSLHADRVVLGTGIHSPFRVVPASIEIEGSTIVSVVEHDRARWRETTRAAVRSIDLGDRVVAPAFIDAHTHLSMSAFRGLIPTGALKGNVVEDLFYRLEDALTDEDIRAFCRMGAFESLAHGVGLVWDHYYAGRSVAAGIADAGLAAVVAPTLQDVHGPGVDQYERQLEATVALDDEAWARRGVWAAVGPHATDTVSPGLFGRIAELARQRSLPIHAHVAQSLQEYERAQSVHGCSPVELLQRCGVLDEVRVLLVHMIFASDADLDLLEPARHALAYCPLSQLQFCFPAHVASWSDHDLPWIVATDCAPSNDALHVQRELPLVAAARGFAATASEAYAAFRRDPGPQTARDVDAVRTDAFEQHAPLVDPASLLARVWSIPGSMHPRVAAGELRAGALANLQVLDPGHPSMWPCRDVVRTLAMADTSPALEKLMVAGSWSPVAGGRMAHDAGYQEARDEADRRLSAHLSRIGWSS